MARKILFPALVAVILMAPGRATAESLSERLEKGIYTEETVGNLDAAVNIYQQIVADAEADRAVAARAQFRLGQCLLKQEKNEEAIAAFKTLIKDFADQEELVAKAKKFVPSRPNFEMQPVPWVDGESLQLRARLATGLEIGTFLLSAKTAQENGTDIWLMNLGRYISINAPNQGISRVKADRSTFLPMSSIFRHTILGTIESKYTQNQVTIRSVGLDGKEKENTIDLDGVYYDNEQGMLLFRRLPLTKDFKAEVPICATMGSGPMKIKAEVTAIETIEVPAGKYECYRLLLPMLQQTFWISTDKHRYLVQFQAGGISAELVSIRENKPGELVEYRDDELKFSITAPTEWYFVKQQNHDGDDKVVYLLLDPEAEAISSLVTKPIDKLDDEQKASPRALAESRFKKDQKAYQNLTIRPDSWQDRTLSGAPAVSYIADYVTLKKPKVRYCIYGLGATTAVEFCTRIEPDRFDRFQVAVDAIVDTFQEKTQ